MEKKKSLIDSLDSYFSNEGSKSSLETDLDNYFKDSATNTATSEPIKTTQKRKLEPSELTNVLGPGSVFGPLAKERAKKIQNVNPEQYKQPTILESLDEAGKPVNTFDILASAFALFTSAAGAGKGLAETGIKNIPRASELFNDLSKKINLEGGIYPTDIRTGKRIQNPEDLKPEDIAKAVELFKLVGWEPMGAAFSGGLEATRGGRQAEDLLGRAMGITGRGLKEAGELGTQGKVPSVRNILAPGGEVLSLENQPSPLDIINSFTAPKETGGTGAYTQEDLSTNPLAAAGALGVEFLQASSPFVAGHMGLNAIKKAMTPPKSVTMFPNMMVDRTAGSSGTPLIDINSKIIESQRLMNNFNTNESNAYRWPTNIGEYVNRDLTPVNNIGEVTRTSEGAIPMSPPSVDLIDTANATKAPYTAEDMKQSILNDTELNQSLANQTTKKSNAKLLATTPKEKTAELEAIRLQKEVKAQQDLKNKPVKINEPPSVSTNPVVNLNKPSEKKYIATPKEVDNAIEHINNLKEPSKEKGIETKGVKNKTLLVKFSNFLKSKNINTYEDLSNYATSLLSEDKAVLKEFNNWLGKPENGGRSYSKWTDLLSPKFNKALGWDPNFIFRGNKIKGFAGKPINIKSQATVPPTIEGAKKIKEGLNTLKETNPTDALLIGGGMEAGFRPGDLFSLKLGDFEITGGQLVVGKTQTNKNSQIHKGLSFVNPEMIDFYERHLAKLQEMGYDINDPNTPLLPLELLKDYYRTTAEGKNSTTNKLSKIISNMSGEKLGNYSLRKTPSVTQISKEGYNYAKTILKDLTGDELTKAIQDLTRNSVDDAKSDIDADYKDERTGGITKAETFVNAKRLTHVGDEAKENYMATTAEAMRAFNAGVRDYLTEKKTPPVTTSSKFDKILEDINPEIPKGPGAQTLGTQADPFEATKAPEAKTYNEITTKYKQAIDSINKKLEPFTKYLETKLDKLFGEGKTSKIVSGALESLRRDLFVNKNNPDVPSLFDPKTVGSMAITSKWAEKVIKDKILPEAIDKYPNDPVYHALIKTYSDKFVHVVNTFLNTEHNSNRGRLFFYDQLKGLLKDHLDIGNIKLLEDLKQQIVEQRLDVKDIIEKSNELLKGIRGNNMLKHLWEGMKEIDAAMSNQKLRKVRSTDIYDWIEKQTTLTAAEKTKLKNFIPKYIEYNDTLWNSYVSMCKDVGIEPAKRDINILHVNRMPKMGKNLVVSSLSGNQRIIGSGDALKLLYNEMVDRGIVGHLIENAKGVIDQNVIYLNSKEFGKIWDDLTNHYGTSPDKIAMIHSAAEMVFDSIKRYEISSGKRVIGLRESKDLVAKWKADNTAEVKTYNKLLRDRTKIKKEAPSDSKDFRLAKIEKQIAEFRKARKEALKPELAKRLATKSIQDEIKKIVYTAEDKAVKSFREFSIKNVKDIKNDPLLNKILEARDIKIRKGINEKLLSNWFEKTVLKDIEEFVTKRDKHEDTTGISERLSQYQDLINEYKKAKREKGDAKEVRSIDKKSTVVKKILGVNDDYYKQQVDNASIKDLFFKTDPKVDIQEVLRSTLIKWEPDSLRPRLNKSMYYEVRDHFIDNATQLTSDLIEAGNRNHALGIYEREVNGRTPGMLEFSKLKSKDKEGNILPNFKDIQSMGLRQIHEAVSKHGPKTEWSSGNRVLEKLGVLLNYTTGKTGHFTSGVGKFIASASGDVFGTGKVVLNTGNILIQPLQALQTLYTFWPTEMRFAIDTAYKNDISKQLGLDVNAPMKEINKHINSEINKVAIDAGAQSIDVLNRLNGKSYLDKLSSVSVGRYPGIFKHIPGAGLMARALKFTDGLSRKYTLAAIARAFPETFNEYIKIEKKLQENGYDLSKLSPEEYKLKANIYRTMETRSVGMGRATEIPLMYDPFGLWQASNFMHLGFGQLKTFDFGQWLNYTEMFKEFTGGIERASKESKLVGSPLLKELATSMTEMNKETFRTPLDFVYYHIGQTAVFGLKGTVGLAVVKYSLAALGGIITAFGTLVSPFSGEDKTAARAIIKFGQDTQLFIPRLESSFITFLNKTGGTTSDYWLAALMGCMTYGIPTQTIGADISIKAENRWFDPTPIQNIIGTLIQANQISKGETVEPIEKIILQLRASVFPTLFNQIYRSQKQKFDKLKYKQANKIPLTQAEQNDMEYFEKYWNTSAWWGPLIGGKEAINMASNAQPFVHNDWSTFVKGALGLSDVKDTRYYTQKTLIAREEKMLDSRRNSVITVMLNKAGRLSYDHGKEFLINEIKKYQTEKGVALPVKSILSRFEKTANWPLVFKGKWNAAAKDGTLPDKIKIWKKNGDIDRYLQTLQSAGKLTEANNLEKILQKY